MESCAGWKTHQVKNGLQPSIPWRLGGFQTALFWLVALRLPSQAVMRIVRMR